MGPRDLCARKEEQIGTAPSAPQKSQIGPTFPRLLRLAGEKRVSCVTSPFAVGDVHREAAFWRDYARETRLDFQIGFVDSEPPLAHGVIRLGAHGEAFESSLEHWPAERYLRQWQEALQRILDGRKNSAFITSITDPRSANFIRWWVAYRVGSSICFQEHVLFLNSATEGFDESDPYRSVPKRETVGEEAERISEWILPLQRRVAHQ